MNTLIDNELELMIRKKTLQDVEIWLNEQYLEIAKQLIEIKAKSVKLNEGENEDDRKSKN